jgi:hypothetical protein
LRAPPRRPSVASPDARAAALASSPWCISLSAGTRHGVHQVERPRRRLPVSLSEKVWAAYTIRCRAAAFAPYRASLLQRPQTQGQLLWARHFRVFPCPPAPVMGFARFSALDAGLGFIGSRANAIAGPAPAPDPTGWVNVNGGAPTRGLRGKELNAETVRPASS